MKKLIPFILLVLILAACGQDNDTSNGTSDELVAKPIDVQLDAPEQVDVNKAITFSATVTQGGEVVEDAEEVEFEIWLDGQKDTSELIPATNEGDGVYSVEKTFAKDGIYYVQSHVTARSMHTMPKAQVTVGNPDTTKAPEEDQTENGHHEGDHSHSHVIIQLDQPNQLKTGEEAIFTAKATHDKQPITEANVTLEVFQEGVEKHDWIKANETDTGTYEANVTFAKTGSYSVKVHVEKNADEKIHDHKLYTVEVN